MWTRVEKFDTKGKSETAARPSACFSAAPHGGAASLLASRARRRHPLAFFPGGNAQAMTESRREGRERAREKEPGRRERPAAGRRRVPILRRQLRGSPARPRVLHRLSGRAGRRAGAGRGGRGSPGGHALGAARGAWAGRGVRSARLLPPPPGAGGGGGGGLGERRPGLGRAGGGRRRRRRGGGRHGRQGVH